jgi:hypothetical protein
MLLKSVFHRYAGCCKKKWQEAWSKFSEIDPKWHFLAFGMVYDQKGIQN